MKVSDNATIELGTPLPSKAAKFMLLGSGELGKEEVIEFQRYGVEVVAVDRYDHARALAEPDTQLRLFGNLKFEGKGVWAFAWQKQGRLRRRDRKRIKLHPVFSIL